MYNLTKKRDMSNYKITISGGDNEWTLEEFDIIVESANKLSNDLGLNKDNFLITNFKVIGGFLDAE
jgi:hypothetical protein